MVMGLVHVLIYLIVWGLIFYIVWWGISKIGLPEPFAKIAIGILVIIAVLVLLNLLLGIVGSPLVEWRKL